MTISPRRRIQYLSRSLLLALVATCASLWSQTLPLSDPAAGPGGWQSREYAPTGEPKLLPLSARPAEDGVPASLVMPISLPGKDEFVLPLKASWENYRTLELDFILPEGLPAEDKGMVSDRLPEQTVLYVFTKDWDHLWRQVRIPVPNHAGAWTVRVPIAGQAAVDAWESRGHDRPWNAVITKALLEVGCSFNLEPGENASFDGQILLTGIRLADPGLPDETPKLRALHCTPDSPQVGKRVEFDFEYAEWIADPFDPAKTSISAKIVQPDGKEVAVRGFYYEGFLYNPEVEDKTQTLTPQGRPRFKVRYCPLQPGKHTVTITATANGRTVTAPPLTFSAIPAEPDYRGFVRRDPQEEIYLAWDNGDPFWGVGINVRSPYDNRYVGIAPYSPWRNEGLPMYERLFAKYEEVGITVAEVWMSSWWLALEWINDAPGFHGVGHYNQYRAWMLDHILESAERHNIRLLLVFNNHGKFGMKFDTEWGRNPYNKACGGFLDTCEQYFTDARAKQAFKRTCDYIVARWGYSPNIMAWKLFTEVDLTGPDLQYYLQPEVGLWHQEMGAYLKSIDPNHHLVTTHWMLGYHKINDAIANVKELDFLSTDAYYQGGGTEKLLEMLRGGAVFARGKHKPLLITEFGGSPYADSMGNLIKQSHLGIWTGFFAEAPASPMYWWFALAEDKDLYSRYTSLRNYSTGVDRRGLAYNARPLGDAGLAVADMAGVNRYYAWVFDSGYYTSPVENLTPQEWQKVSLPLKAPAAGDYKLEIWDVAKGDVAETRQITVAPNTPTLTVDLPSFTLDVALKLEPIKQ
jgi:hypothetical protein